MEGGDVLVIKGVGVGGSAIRCYKIDMGARGAPRSAADSVQWQELREEE